MHSIEKVRKPEEKEEKQAYGSFPQPMLQALRSEKEIYLDIAHHPHQRNTYDEEKYLQNNFDMLRSKDKKYCPSYMTADIIFL